MRVVIGEDQALMLEGLKLLLERDGAEAVGSAQDAPELIRKANPPRPDPRPSWSKRGRSASATC